MSKALDRAEMIVARITAAVAERELPTPIDLTDADFVIVDRQKNILSEITAKVKKVTGVAVVVLWTGWRVADKNANPPRLEYLYTVRIWSKPIIDQGAYPADDVAEAVILRLWQWKPDDPFIAAEAEVGNGELVPDKAFLVYEFPLTLPVCLRADETP